MQIFEIAMISLTVIGAVCVIAYACYRGKNNNNSPQTGSYVIRSSDNYSGTPNYSQNYTVTQSPPNYVIQIPQTYVQPTYVPVTSYQPTYQSQNSMSTFYNNFLDQTYQEEQNRKNKAEEDKQRRKEESRENERRKQDRAEQKRREQLYNNAVACGGDPDFYPDGNGRFN